MGRVCYSVLPKAFDTLRKKRSKSIVNKPINLPREGSDSFLADERNKQDLADSDAVEQALYKESYQSFSSALKLYYVMIHGGR